MRKCFVIILFLQSIINTVQSQTHDVNQWPQLMELAQKDSVAEIERLAALKFHVLINDYRKSKGLDTLLWNEVMWISSRNHCVWMTENDQLSHAERTNTKYFTGPDPSKRYQSASLGRTEGSYTAENILYHYSSNGRQKNRIAREIAETSFSNWKNSPGHNASMLSPKSTMHGVAFLVELDGKVWGADLFGQCKDCIFGPPKPKPVLAEKYQLLKSSSKEVDKEELQALVTELQKVIEDSLYKEQNKNSKNAQTRKMKLEKIARNYMEVSVKSSSSAILKNKSRVESYKSINTYEYDAYRVVRGGKKNKTGLRILENEIILEKEAVYFTIEETLSDILSIFNKSAYQSDVFREVGFCVSIQKKNSEVIITVVRIMGN